jgi:hypothetical protein
MKSQRLERHKPSNIASEWLIGCESEQEKEDRKAYLANSRQLVDLLKNMIQKRYDDLSGVKVTDYDSPSWSHKRAHLDGQLAALESIYKLLP